MNTPAVWVPNAIAKKAAVLLASKNGKSIKEGVELLLSNDLSVDGISLEPSPERTNAGHLLCQGLAALASSPHQALEVPIGAKTVEIRTAYKKMALKYHPDKNPKGTPIFQAIKTAFDKLSDSDQRIREEHAAKSSASAASTSTAQPRSTAQPQPTQQKPAQPERKKPTPPPPNTSYESHQHAKPQQQQYQQPQSTQQQQQRATQDDAARREADKRAKEAQLKREEEIRNWAKREAEAAKHRSSILKEGQKAFEAQRLREQALKREQEAAENNVRGRRATYNTGNSSSSNPEVQGFRAGKWILNFNLFVVIEMLCLQR